MMTLAKALYDNTAECPDELAFRKGDILTVLEQNVSGTSGWWMCSLYGRHGLAPANRLCLLSQTNGAPAATPSPKQGKPQTTEQTPSSSSSPHNIYQIPSVKRANSAVCERTKRFSKVPSIPSSVNRAPGWSALQQVSEEQRGNKPFSAACSAKGELYDVPSQVRRASLFPVSTTPRASVRKHSLVPISELQKRFDSPPGFLLERSNTSCIYDIPPTLTANPTYHIPVPSDMDPQKSTTIGYNTLPVLRKPEWIYDVPVSPDKHSSPRMLPENTPPRVSSPQLYDTIPARDCSFYKGPKSPLLNNIPMSRSLDSPPTLPPRVPLPPRSDSTEQESVYDLPSDEHIPLECRVDPPEATKVSLFRWKKCPSFRRSSGGPVLVSLEGSQGLDISSTQNQRISTASSSSSSSCDSFALSSSSPEPLMEVSLRHDEVSRRLLDLQGSVCKAVPRIMEFVSSGWRSRSHMEKHLEEIKEAAREVVASLSGFLNFAMDIKGNALRLTDCNLQARLYKQLCAVEDSGVILQQTETALNAAGWTVELLSQEPLVQTPDHLERFVMVARTIPEDVKRLVSMINANGKLLFKPPQKEPESEHSESDPHKGSEVCEVNAADDDYVELETKDDFEHQQNEMQKDGNANPAVSFQKLLGDKKPTLSGFPCGSEEQKPSSLLAGPAPFSEKPASEEPVPLPEHAASVGPVPLTEQPASVGPVSLTEYAASVGPVPLTEHAASVGPVPLTEHAASVGPVPLTEYAASVGPVPLTEQPASVGPVSLTECAASVGPVPLTEHAASVGPVPLTEQPASEGPVSLTDQPASEGPVSLTDQPASEGPVSLTDQPASEGPVSLAEQPASEGPISASEHSASPTERPTEQPASVSEHCRLYFGALQKAIGGFVESLKDGQPPERFISQSKLVIMVGQRLVNTLYKEAQSGESRQSLLCKSSHLCALLKQLAVATKKAALHFPDRQAVHEALEFAKELAQRAQHFRLSLNL